jgi:hypothetical protein
MQAKGMGKQFSVDGSWILKSGHRGEHENFRRVPQENESENSAALSILAKALNRKVAKKTRSTPSASPPFRELCAFSW